MEWREQDGITKSQLKNMELTHEHFVEIWQQFFSVAFTKTDKDWDEITRKIWTWDCIVCEVCEHPWQIAILPYDSQDHWADRSRMVVVSLLEHDQMTVGMEQDDYITRHHEDNFMEMVQNLVDHLLRMMIAAFRDYGRASNFWGQDSHDVTMVRFFRHIDEKFATLSVDDIVYHV